MDTQPEQQAIRIQEIHFSNGNQARAVISSGSASTTDLLHALSIPQPAAVILLAGGAMQMDEIIHPDLVQLFTHGIAHAAASLDALIIDGGTQSGVMALMGQGVAGQQKSVTLLGVTLSDHVTYPGNPRRPQRESIPLEPNHTHLVLVEAEEWEDVTKTMYDLAHALAAHCPSVAVLVNGGPIAQSEILYNVRQGRPIIVIEGSGRLANDLASIKRGQPIPTRDPALAEIARHGTLHMFPFDGNMHKFTQLVERLLYSP